MGAIRGRYVQWSCVVAAALATIGAIAPSIGASREGGLRRDTLKSFAEDFQESERYPVVRACRLVHSLTEHSVERRVGVWENWVQWLLGQAYLPLLRSQNADRILERGFGDCSERVAVLQSLVRKARLTTRIIGLGGHVVLEVHANGKWYTLDPDYGIVYAKSVAELQEVSDAAISRPLLRAGFDATTIDEYLRILKSTHDNIALPVNAPLSPRLNWIEQLCGFLLIAIPCLLWMLVAILWLGRRDAVQMQTY